MREVWHNGSNNCVVQTETSASKDMDIQKEYARQREHLERSVQSLRKKMAVDSEIHRVENVKVMQVSAFPVRVVFTT